MLPRIVITGIGVISPAGTGPGVLYLTLLNGKSQTRRIESFNTEHLPCKIGAQVLDFSAKDFFNAQELKRLDRSSQFFVAAGMMALRDSHYSADQFDNDKIGVFEGSSLGGMECALEEHEILVQKGPRAINPFLINKAMNGIGGSMVAMQHQIHGPVVSFSNGSVSSACAMIAAINSLRLGEIDLAIAGGCEAPVTYNMFSIFSRAGVLTNQEEYPETASRPFDATRDGLVLGEGGACIILERLETALERGATIYAEVLSTAINNDGVSLVAPANDAVQQSKVMLSAVSKAGIASNEIDYISAHGTSTHLNDSIETLAIRKAFGNTADEIPVSATKSMLGHSLGACTAIEVNCALLAMKYNFIPPTINLHQCDPACNLNYVPNEPIKKEINTVLLKNSSFGGKNTAIILRKYHS